jgi:hypothetical protein
MIVGQVAIEARPSRRMPTHAPQQKGTLFNHFVQHKQAAVRLTGEFLDGTFDVTRIVNWCRR